MKAPKPFTSLLWDAKSPASTRSRTFGRGLAAAAGLFALLLTPLAQAEYPGMGDVVMANGFDYATLYRGGANYLWHQLDQPACLREPYGLVPNYHQPGVRAKAQQQLVAMHAAGMRSLNIGVSFRDGPPSGTLIDAADPAAVLQAADNLSDLLIDIDTAGFERVLFRFFPEGNMSPSNPSFVNTTLDLYKDMVAAMRARLVAGPVPYLIDLGVEGAPADADNWWRSHEDKWKDPANEKWSNAARDLWTWYTVQYGYADTVGFSFLTATNRAKRRLRHMRYVYQREPPFVPAYPPVFAMDFYGEAGHDEGDQFIEMVYWTRHYSPRYGYPMPNVIIAETWYNDPWAAESLSSAVVATGHPVDYLAEWPLGRGSSCEHVSEPPPYEFDIYRIYGF